MNRICEAYIIMLLNLTSDDRANCFGECGGGLNMPVTDLSPRFNGNILQS